MGLISAHTGNLLSRTVYELLLVVMVCPFHITVLHSNQCGFALQLGGSEVGGIT